jgi:hypothetical protein
MSASRIDHLSIKYDDLPELDRVATLDTMKGILPSEAALRRFRFTVLLFTSVVTASFAGETNTLPTAITVDGHTYSNVTWRTVTPATVSIIHTTGAATIPLEKLPAELRSRFGYDEAKARQYRQTQIAADLHQREQTKLQMLRGQDLRRIGNKLYDFATVRQLFAQYAECNRKLGDSIGQPSFDDHLKQREQIEAQLKRLAEYCVLGDVSAVQGDLLLVKDGTFGDMVYMMRYPDSGSLLEGKRVATAALWTGNRDGKRVYDCGTIPTDDELLTLPVERVDAK